MEGALFAGNNDFSNIKQYQTLKFIITKITTIICAGCCDGSEPPTEDLTKTDLARKEGIQMMTSKQIGPIPFPRLKIFLANDRLDMDKTDRCVYFLGVPAIWWAS